VSKCNQVVLCLALLALVRTADAQQSYGSYYDDDYDDDANFGTGLGDKKFIRVTVPLPFPCADLAASADLEDALVAAMKKTANGVATRIIKCNGEALPKPDQSKRGRRLSTPPFSDIEFQMAVEGETARLATETLLRQTAKEGTMMINIKEAAKEKNVSTPALQAMNNKVAVLVDDEKRQENGGTNVGLIVGLVVAAAVLLVVILLVVKHKRGSRETLEERIDCVHGMHGPKNAPDASLTGDVETGSVGVGNGRELY